MYIKWKENMKIITGEIDMSKPLSTVVSGFPGVGKSYAKNNVKTLEIVDSDSSKFSWIKEGVKNPEFPKNYISHIQECLLDKDIVLVSSHDVVRDAMTKEDIPFILVYPEIGLMRHYINRFIDRGSPTAFIQLVKKNWHSWIDELDNQRMYG